MQEGKAEKETVADGNENIQAAQDKISRAHGGWRELVRVFLVSLAIVVPIRYFVAQPFIVRGASMEPNFEDSDYLIVDEFSYYVRPPDRNEVIVFRYPNDTRQFFIKRIIGLPGEQIQIKNGVITIKNKAHSDGFVIHESYLRPPNYPTHPDLFVTLGNDEYFVLGDNRDFSSDSRIWGTLKKNLIIGRPLIRAWPLKEAGFIPRYVEN